MNIDFPSALALVLSLVLGYFIWRNIRQTHKNGQLKERGDLVVDRSTEPKQFWPLYLFRIVIGVICIPTAYFLFREIIRICQ